MPHQAVLFRWMIRPPSEDIFLPAEMSKNLDLESRSRPNLIQTLWCLRRRSSGLVSGRQTWRSLPSWRTTIISTGLRGRSWQRNKRWQSENRRPRRALGSHLPYRRRFECLLQTRHSDRHPAVPDRHTRADMARIPDAIHARQPRLHTGETLGTRDSSCAMHAVSDIRSSSGDASTAAMCQRRRTRDFDNVLCAMEHGFSDSTLSSIILHICLIYTSQTRPKKTSLPAASESLAANLAKGKAAMGKVVLVGK